MYSRTFGENRETLDEEANLKSYLYTAAKNRALNHLKRPATYFESLEENEYLLNDEVVNKILYEEIETAIDNAINSLPEKCGMIFKMNRTGMINLLIVK